MHFEDLGFNFLFSIHEMGVIAILYFTGVQGYVLYFTGLCSILEVGNGSQYLREIYPLPCFGLCALVYVHIVTNLLYFPLKMSIDFS